MTNSETTGKSVSPEHRSDGSELTPAEIHTPDPQSADVAPGTGYTTDDEGLINNFAVEPDIYPSEYPSPPQQKRYVLLGTGAVLLIVILLMITFSVS
ncbi:photosystem II assembly protein Psb34 [Planktothrix paucivesiculata]|uniref:Ssl1498 family light-harvesting-like protein n=1 Tax=Planktothrix paucivesiculata PCC 9631 TaxID=671071 RepID=A0A7Z9C079_9CYAN|nr:ssl1498 family light-harvesting-like protein [Planktothrix paucivesiculata]VXD23203.1 conserved hypothetical protein [Planktothrix paucivesiculata PCC 9631]